MTLCPALGPEDTKMNRTLSGQFTHQEHETQIFHLIIIGGWGLETVGADTGYSRRRHQKLLTLIPVGKQPG